MIRPSYMWRDWLTVSWGVSPSYLWDDWFILLGLLFHSLRGVRSTHPKCQRSNETHPDKYLWRMISRRDWLYKREGRSAPHTLLPTQGAQYAFRKQEPLQFMLPCTAGGPHSKGNLKTKISVHKVHKTTNKKVMRVLAIVIQHLSSGVYVHLRANMATMRVCWGGGHW
jgi:hypothetical protein